MSVSTTVAVSPQSAAALAHVCVCICTFKRADLLTRLLQELDRQEIDNLFTFSIVVVDNDRDRSAAPIVAAFAQRSAIPIEYFTEARQNIALARNCAIENAHGDFVAFIDDDEFPTLRWLVTLFLVRAQYDVDGVLGPVKPHFEHQPPAWVLKGSFYDRVSYPTGHVIDWRKGRTGNVLLKKSVFTAGEPPFNPIFLTGEDQEFFGRMIDKGHVFIWCDEALAYETVPPIRWQRKFMLKRALLSGAISLVHPKFERRDIAKSLVAVPAYLAGLPIAFILGQHRFMSCLVKLFDHMGRLLALMGIRPIKQPYVTQ